MYHFYTCQSVICGGTAACPGSRVSLKKLEDFVVSKIAAIGEDAALISATVEAVQKQMAEQQPELKAEVQRLQGEVARLKKQKKSLATRIGNEPDTQDLLQHIQAVAAKLSDATGRLKDAQATLDGLKDTAIDEDHVRSAVASFMPVWNELFPAERERIIRLLIESIVFNAESGEVAITFRPKPEMLKKANEPLYLLRELRKLGELDLVAQTDRLPALALMEPELLAELSQGSGLSPAAFTGKRLFYVTTILLTVEMVYSAATLERVSFYDRGMFLLRLILSFLWGLILLISLLSLLLL